MRFAILFVGSVLCCAGATTAQQTALLSRFAVVRSSRPDARELFDGWHPERAESFAAGDWIEVDLHRDELGRPARVEDVMMIGYAPLSIDVSLRDVPNGPYVPIGSFDRASLYHSQYFLPRPTRAVSMRFDVRAGRGELEVVDVLGTEIWQPAWISSHKWYRGTRTPGAAAAGSIRIITWRGEKTGLVFAAVGSGALLSQPLRSSPNNVGGLLLDPASALLVAAQPLYENQMWDFAFQLPIDPGLISAPIHLQGLILADVAFAGVDLRWTRVLTFH